MKMNKKIKTFLGLIIAVLVVWGIYSFSQKSSESVSTEPIKIGVITILTGNLAFLGENIVNSAELAVKDLQQKEGVEIQLIIEDVGGLAGQGKEAVSALQKLVQVDGVKYIIDGMTSDGTMAVAPLVDQYEVVMITPLTGGENIDNAAEYLFRNGPSDIIAGTKPADQIYNKFNYKKVALLTDNAEYTLDIKKHFANSYLGEVVVDEIITPDNNDYRTELAKVKVSDAEAIFINTATGVSAQYVIKQAGELGVTVPIFANFIAYGPDLIKVAGSYAEGVYIYDPEFDEASSEVKSFMEEYKQEYNFEPPIKFHATGTYDAVVMGAEAIMSIGNDGEKIHDYLLKKIKNWDGLNGKVTFDKKGNSGCGFVLKQVKDGKLVLVK
jgi:branched-chain amino acid transport system substrate-binding protein